MPVSISVTGRRCAISVDDRQLERDGIAEIAAEDAPDEIEELHEHRLVEAELALMRATSASVARSPSMALAGSPGSSRTRTKVDDQDEDEGRDHLQRRDGLQ